MDMVGTLIAALNDASYSGLINKIKDNDCLVLLGSCGFQSVSRIVSSFGLEGGEWFTITVKPTDGRTAGEFNPGTGEISLATNVIEAIADNTSTYMQNDTVLHEVLHRAFAILHQLVSRSDQFTKGSELRAALPQDLLGKWSGGWGSINYQRYPITPTSTGDLGYRGQPIQKNPEHGMIYAHLGSDYAWDAFIKDWVYTDARVAREMGWSGGKYYDGMDGDTMVAYWNNLYDATERAVAGWLINHLGETSERLIASAPEDFESDPDEQRDLQRKLDRLTQLRRLARVAGDRDLIRRIDRLISMLQATQARDRISIGRPTRGGTGMGRSDLGQ